MSPLFASQFWLMDLLLVSLVALEVSDKVITCLPPFSFDHGGLKSYHEEN